MKILGINTATNNLSLALLEDDAVLAEKNLAGPTAKAEQLIPWLKEMLTDLDLTAADLAGIGVAQGPGAFTGLRIGLTSAKTLAQMLSIPLVGISTIKAFAYQYKGQDIPLLRIVLQACRGDINTGLFSDLQQDFRQIENDHAVKAEDLWAQVRSEQSHLAGDVPPEFAGRTLPGVPNAVSIALLARQSIKEGNTAEPQTMVPVYSHGPNIRLSERIHGKLLKNNGN